MVGCENVSSGTAPFGYAQGTGTSGKRIAERHFNLRGWQSEASLALMQNVREGKKVFLCVATPGAGKTKFALAVIHGLLSQGMADRVEIVAPSDNLKRQWAENAAQFAGLDLDPDFKNAQVREASDYHGIVVTYALLGQDKSMVHQQLVNKRRTIVVLDEIHHAGDNLTWGNAVKAAFSEAAFIIALSGTPFRSDANEIPFITYVDGVSKADYTYTYDRAIRENVCRAVYFTVFDGKLKWKVGEEEFEHSFKEYLSPDQASKRLKTALDANSDYVRDVLKAADTKLVEIRQKHTNAAGLVFAATQKHAHDLAKVLESITGYHVPVVVSENTESQSIIDRFRNSRDRWLVSVKMVSEGVDIQRIRVEAYFTIVKAELFFRQAVGRAVRVIEGVEEQDAFVFLPADKDLIKMAKAISEEREHALDELKKQGIAAKDRNNPQTSLFSDYQPALQGKFKPLGGIAGESRIITATMKISSGAKFSTVKARVPGEEEPVYLQKERLRNEINAIVKQVALRFATNGRPDFPATHRMWLQAGGKPIETETIEELKKRKNFYQNIANR
jgi:superfamily II DNA or RNA helicase